MFWKRKNEEQTTAQGTPQLSPQVQAFLGELAAYFPGATYVSDYLNRRHVVSITNGELSLTVEIGFNHPSVAPAVSIVDAHPKFHNALLALAQGGLLDAESGRINCSALFEYTPEMKGSTMLFLVNLILKTARALSATNVSAQQDEERSESAAQSSQTGHATEQNRQLEPELATAGADDGGGAHEQ